MTTEKFFSKMLITIKQKVELALLKYSNENHHVWMQLFVHEKSA